MRRDLAVVLAVVAPLAFAGLGLRDVAGEEVVFYFGLGPAEIVAQALNPAGEGAFHAHQPLSYLVRWVVLALAGEVTATTLRLHAAAFACAGAAATWWVASRGTGRLGAVAAGLMFGVSPLVVFYAHEASNYAATPLFSAVALAGLIDLRGDAPRRGGRLLFVGIVGGMLNDFFFGFAVAAALLLTPWSASSARRAWGAAVVALAPLGAIFAVNLSRVPGAKRLAPHLDPVDAAVGLPAAVAGTFEAAVEGWLVGYTGAAWPTVAGVALLAAPLGLWIRDRRWTPTTLAGAFALSVIGLGGAAAWAAEVALDGRLATAPRSLLAALPALCLGIAGAPRGRPALVALVGAGVLVIQLPASVRVAVDPPRGMRAVGERLRAERTEGDLVVGTAAHRVGLGPEAGVVATSFDGCVGTAADLAAIDRVWVVGPPPGPAAGCDGPIDLVAAGFGPTVHEQHGRPDHDFETPSFLSDVHLTRWDRGAAAGEGPFVRRVRVPGGRGELVAKLMRPDGIPRYQTATLTDGVAALTLHTPPGGLLEVTVGAGPPRRQRLVIDGPRAVQEWTLRRPPLSGLAAASGFGPWLALGALVVGVARRRPLEELRSSP